MNKIRPGILVISLAAVAASALLVWMTRSENPMPEGQLAQAPAAAAPLAAPEEEAVPQPSPTPKPAAPEVKSKVRRHPLGKKYAEKERQRKISEREEALDRLNALKYSDFAANRIRDAWEESLRQAEDELKLLEATQGNIGARERNLARRAAWERVRSEFGDEDYESARYAADLSTWVGISSLTPNSPAEMLGLAEGDQLYSYNGQRVFEVREVGALWAAEPVDGIATLGFVRGGELFFLDVDRGYLGVPLAGRVVPPN